MTFLTTGNKKAPKKLGLFTVG